MPVSNGSPRDRQYRAAIEYEQSVWQNRNPLSFVPPVPLPDGQESAPAYIDTRAVLARRHIAVRSQFEQSWEPYTLLQGWPNQAQSSVPAIPQFGRDIRERRARFAAVNSESGVWQNLQNTLLFAEPVVEAPFFQTDWPLPAGYAVARRTAQAQVAARAETEVLQDTPLVLLTTPPPPVLSTMPDYLAAPYKAKAGRHVALRAPPEVIGSFPTIILTTPGFNLVPGVVVAPAFLAVNYRRNATHNALRAQVGGDPQTWLTTPPPPEGRQKLPADVRDRTRAGRYAATRFLEQGQNENPLLALPDGRTTYPDRLPRPPYRQYQVEGDPQTWLTTPPPPDGKQELPASVRDIPGARRRLQAELAESRGDPQTWLTTPPPPEGRTTAPDRLPRAPYRQYQVEGDPQAWLTTPPPPEGRTVQPDAISRFKRTQPELTQNLLNSTLSVVADTIPEGRATYPDRLPRVTRLQPLNGLGGVIIGEEVLFNGHLPSIPKFGRDIALSRRAQVAVKSEADVWQNLQGTLLAGVVEAIPDGKSTYPDRLPRPRPPQVGFALGDAQAWLTTADQPDGKREFPAAIRGIRRVQPELVQVSQDLLATVVVATLPEGQSAVPAHVRGRVGLRAAITSQPRTPIPTTIFVVPLTLRLVINSNPSDAPEIDSNPSDPARVGS